MDIPVSMSGYGAFYSTLFTVNEMMSINNVRFSCADGLRECDESERIDTRAGCEERLLRRQQGWQPESAVREHGPLSAHRQSSR